jgi:hypothetical protein
MCCAICVCRRWWGGRSIWGVGCGRELVRLNVTGGKTNGEDGQSWMEGLREEVGGEGQGAKGVKHFEGGPYSGRSFPCDTNVLTARESICSQNKTKMYRVGVRSSSSSTRTSKIGEAPTPRPDSRKKTDNDRHASQRQAIRHSFNYACDGSSTAASTHGCLKSLR